MALITRLGKGSPLTFTEMDNNLLGLASGSNLTPPVTLPGPVTITTPASGVALTVSALAGQFTATFNSGSTGGAALLLNGPLSGPSTGINFSENNVSKWQLLEGNVASGTISFFSATTGLTQLSATGAGNWTIASPSSGATLTVNAVSGNSAIFTSDGTAQFELINNGASGVIAGTATNHQLLLYTNNTSRVVLGAAGNVTINAPASGTALTVNGLEFPIQASGSSVNDITSTNSNNNSAGTSQWQSIVASGPTTTLGALGTGFGSQGYIGTTTNHPCALVTNNAARINIAAAGSVTINTPTSGVALAVNGVAGTDIADFGTVNNGSNAQVGIANNGTGAASANLLISTPNGTSNAQVVVSSNAGIGYIGTATNSTFTFLSNNTSRGTISGAGNWALPAPSSGQTLTITGTAAGTAAVTINTAGTTGAQTATFSATNKPGSGTTSPSKWLPIIMDGTTYYIPAWQ